MQGTVRAQKKSTMGVDNYKASTIPSIINSITRKRLESTSNSGPCTPNQDGSSTKAQLMDSTMSPKDTRTKSHAFVIANGRWSKEEDKRLRMAVERHGAQNWKEISLIMAKFGNGMSRSDTQCLHRWKKVLKPGILKGPWSKEEDNTLVKLVSAYHGSVVKWTKVAEQLPGRLGKQARERWFNHLDPTLKKEPWSDSEHSILIASQRELGNKWTEIAKRLPGRSENAVKNRWNSCRRRHSDFDSSKDESSHRYGTDAKARAQIKTKGDYSVPSTDSYGKKKQFQNVNFALTNNTKRKNTTSVSSSVHRPASSGSRRTTDKQPRASTKVNDSTYRFKTESFTGAYSYKRKSYHKAEQCTAALSKRHKTSSKVSSPQKVSLSNATLEPSPKLPASIRKAVAPTADNSPKNQLNIGSPAWSRFALDMTSWNNSRGSLKGSPSNASLAMPSTPLLEPNPIKSKFPKVEDFDAELGDGFCDDLNLLFNEEFGPDADHCDLRDDLSVVGLGISHYA